MTNTSVTSIPASAIADHNYSHDRSVSNEANCCCGNSMMGKLLSMSAMKKLAHEQTDNQGCTGSGEAQSQEDQEQRTQTINQTINKAISNLTDLSWLSPFIENEGSMNPEQTLAVLDRYFDEIKGKDNLVSRDDLQKISEGKSLQGPHDTEISYAKDLQAAARHLIRQQSDFESLDTAQERKSSDALVNKADGFFSKGDLASALSNTPMADGDMDVLRTLMHHADEMGSRITQHDMKNFVRGSTKSEELKSAAAYVLEHKDFWTRLDTALRMSKCDVSEQGGDGIVSAEDIRVLADRPEFRMFSKNDSA